MLRLTLLLTSAFVSTVLGAPINADQPPPQNPSSTSHPDGKGDRPSNPPASTTAGTSNGISYHGGPIMLGTTNVYYIWYGAWTPNSTPVNILTNLAQNIGGSPYFNINTTYYNGSNQYISNLVTYKNSFFDNYSQGTSISDEASITTPLYA